MSREMKYSGVEWIGTIPNSWETPKLSYVVDCLDGKRVPISSELRKSGPYPYWGAGNITDYVDDYIFNEELVLLGEDGAPFFDKKRNVAFYVKEKIWVNNHIHVLRARNTVKPMFLTHFLNIVDYGSYINGSILNKLTQSNMRKISIALPSLVEQGKIEELLNIKVLHINSLIDKTKATIDDYKLLKQSIITEAVTKGLDKNVEMKDSGIEWIGEIPKNWGVAKIKDLFFVKSGATPSSSVSKYWDGEINWVTPADFKTQDVYVKESKRKVTQEGLDSCGTAIVPDGSVILSSRAPIGSVVLTKGSICTNQGCRALVLKSNNIIPKFYYYYLSVMTEQLNMLGRGTTFLELSATETKRFCVVVPDKRAQEEVVNYLDKQSGYIDELIKKKESLLQELEAYKKSLIYEYVTGKKEVE